MNNCLEEEALHENAENSGSKPAPQVIEQKIMVALRTISENIEQLQRLSNAIRRSGVERQNLKAIDHVLKDDDGKNVDGYDLAAAFKEYASNLFAHMHPEASKTLQERIASSILERRKRFLYRRKHQKKLAASSSNPSKPLGNRVPLKLVPGASEQVSTPMPQPNQVAAAPSRIKSQTTATAFDPDIFQVPVPKSSKKSTVKSAPLTQDTKHNFPLPPRIQDGEEEFECPYCCLLLPVKEGKTERAWR